MQLQYRLEDTIEIDGINYELDTSFDVVLRAIDCLGDETLSSLTRLNTSFRILFKDESILDKFAHYDSSQKSEIIDNILQNYIGGSEEDNKEYDILGNVIEKPTSTDSPKLMDFNVDAELIYSAFMQVYKIDLIDEQGKLSWYKFKALLNSLPEDTEFMKIVQIRAWKPSSDKKRYSEQMRELQNKYKLK